MTIMTYECPDCGRQLKAPGAHQHEDGEWKDFRLPVFEMSFGLDRLISPAVTNREAR